MQSHMNPTKDTEGVDLASHSERFGEKESTEDRSEVGVADFKLMREEMKVLMELVNQVTAESQNRENEKDSAMLSALRSQIDELLTTESPIRENEKDSAKLSALLSQFDELNLEKEEKDAIHSSKEHCDFYVMFVQKLRCMVTACETRATGMVACGNGQSLRSAAVQMVQGQSLGSLKRTKVGVLVAETIKWCKQQAPFPFMDAIGSVIQTLATLNEERDKFIGVARVADFATIAAIVEDADGVHRTIERTARHLIRSRRLVGTKEEFGVWSQRLLKLMAEPGCTRSKAEACLVADEALATLMKPVDHCPVRRIVEGLDRSTRLLHWMLWERPRKHLSCGKSRSSLLRLCCHPPTRVPW
jgi:hypothetical protein